MSIAERLVERIRKEAPFDVPDGTRAIRCYPGHWQRAEGAWVWCLVFPDHYWPSGVGSRHPMGQCVVAKSLRFSRGRDNLDYHVDPAAPAAEQEETE